MADPLSAALLGTLAKLVGTSLAPRVLEWAKGNESQRLVRLLRRDHPAARKMLTQPAVLVELWHYAETGELRSEELLSALRAIEPDERRRRELADAIRTSQWRAVRDERRVHFDLQRMQREMRAERANEQAVLVAGVEDSVGRALERVRPRLAALRGLPAETDAFVDRDAELAQADAHLSDGAPPGAGALVLSCSGMPGVGSSALGLRLAHQHEGRFPGGVLYADFRRADGTRRSPGEVAAQLLRALGVAADAVPTGGDEERLAALRSLLAETPVLMLLDNARSEAEVRALVPANPASVVVVASTAALAGIMSARLLELEPLAPADGVALLRTVVGERVDRELDAAHAIVDACQGLPMALSIAAAKLRRRPRSTLAAYARALADESSRLAHLSDRERALTATFTTTTDALRGLARRLFFLLAALDVQDVEPALCAALLDVDEAAAAAVLDQLEDERLLLPEVGGVRRMHGLLRLHGHAAAERELGAAAIASAQRRRVRWLVSAVADAGPDIAMEG